MTVVNANNQGSQAPERNYREREGQGKQREQLLQKKNQLMYRKETSKKYFKWFLR